MMEQVDRSGQEEFIWAMRTRVTATQDDDSSVNWRDRLFSKSSLSAGSLQKRSVESVSVTQCKMLATMVPDEVISEPHNYKPRKYEACLLCGHISGLNELYQEYSTARNVGCSSMTQIINTYLGAMIQEILLFCGDVVKLNGDNILSMWKTGINNQAMADCVHQAIDCALSIRKSCGYYETDVGVTLKVKIAIVCGEMIFKLLGNESRSYYIVYGNSILGVADMQNNLQGGDIAISKLACNYVNMAEYVYELVEEKDFAKILGASTYWRSSQRNFGRDDYADINVAPGNDINDQIPVEFFDLRPALGTAIRLEMKDDLRKFIPVTILRGIDMEEPIEYFTEMRNIVVTYIDISIEKSTEVGYLDVVDYCYQCIEKVVNDMDGSINQVTLFIKNCTFLVIFGLRGFRHFFESRRALACAMKMYKMLLTIESVVMVTISVTTGMTYCGAIGHMLRREYSVMSMGVNNALLLIQAFPTKITCDKATFLQSKLDPIQFVLQEPDIKINIGPIYQYVEQNKASMPHHAITQYPLLDRDIHLAVYTTMLEASILKQKKSRSDRDRLVTEALVVHGKPKEGKTRLTEEYLFSTPNDIPMFRIKLVPSDKFVPYQAIYFLFCVPLGIKEYSSAADRHAKILSKLKNQYEPKMYCTLNPVFRVKFEKSHLINSMTEREKFHALCRTIKQLCYACFTILWVIIIDGGENMDDESWSLIKPLIDSGRIFLVITVTHNFDLSPIAELVLKSRCVRVVELTPIDKWFHVGLACQFLNVSGIPAEVEKVLHNKSKGNPGWIESYLITLMHSGALEIKTIPVKDVREYGLVISPTEMVTRLSQYNLLESKTSTFHLIKHRSKVYFHIVDKWRIYKYSFKDSTTDIGKIWSDDTAQDPQTESVGSKIEIRNEIEKNPHTIDICVVVDPDKIDDIDSESSIDSIVVKVLDCLTSYEQLLLKASSVIGETLPRDMLHYVMDITDLKKAALAVQRLFEVGVLGCARGKFSYMGSNAILNTPTTTESSLIECRCEGLKIPEPCRNLPRYASCGYIFFKIEAFREMTYTLLTVYQRNEFHFRAIRYLEKKTRKCIKCGGGFFNKLVGNNYSEVEKKKKQTVSLSSYNSQHEKRASLRKSMYDIESTTTVKSKDATSLEDSIKESSMSKNQYNGSVRSFSSNDFSNCECTRILFCMYRQIVTHTEAIGQMEKWLFANLEYGQLCIDTHNIPLALKVLNKAKVTFDASHNLIVKVGESWRVPFIKAKILITIAKARLEIGQVHGAFALFEEALNKLSYRLPTTKSLKYKIITFQQYMYLMHNKRYGLRAKSYSAEYCDNVAECLNNLCTLFIELEMFGPAEITAVCSLKKVLQSEKNFVILINAFTNILTMYLLKRKTKYLQPLETKALFYCKQYFGVVDVKDLEAIAYLYTVIFKSRVWRCELDDAVVVGKYLLKICSSINQMLTNFEIYPLLVQVLILKNRMIDAVMIFSSVEQSSLDDLDYYDLTWYYSLCICFHLETGYMVIPFEVCEHYRFTEAKNFASNREPTAQKRYYIVLWLWLLRNGRNEDAEVWEAKIDRTWVLREYETLVNLFTGLYYLEGLILQIVYKMDKMNNLELKENYSFINQLFAQLFGYAQHAQVIEPRLQHLKAFYLLTIQQDSEAYSVLNKARKLAIQAGNIYEENWINHTEQAWKQELTAIDYHFWRDHAITDCLSYHLLETSDKLGYYTLEPPLYA